MLAPANAASAAETGRGSPTLRGWSTSAVMTVPGRAAIVRCRPSTSSPRRCAHCVTPECFSFLFGEPAPSAAKSNCDFDILNRLLLFYSPAEDGGKQRCASRDQKERRSQPGARQLRRIRGRQAVRDHFGARARNPALLHAGRADPRQQGPGGAHQPAEADGVALHLHAVAARIPQGRPHLVEISARARRAGDRPSAARHHHVCGNWRGRR